MTADPPAPPAPGAPPPRKRVRGLALVLGFAVLAGGVLAAKLLSESSSGTASGDEQIAISTLAEIASGQAAFRRDDADGDARYDYGTLEELCRFGLVDAELAKGTRAGYSFTCDPHPHTPEFVWWATATPQREGVGRAFAVNQRGAIVAREAPFPTAPQPVLPADVAPIRSVSVAADDSTGE